jgi:hypothetical protein
LRVLKINLTHFRYKTLPPPPPLLPTTTTLDFEKARPYSARSVLNRSGILFPRNEINLRVLRTLVYSFPNEDEASAAAAADDDA